MNYDEFVSQNPALDPLDSIRKFTDSARADYLAAGELTPELNAELDKAAFGQAISSGLIPEPADDAEAQSSFDSFRAKPVSNKLLGIAARRLSEDGDEDNAQKLRAYAALQAPAVKANFATEEDHAAALATAKADAESVLDEKTIADTKRFAVRNGFAKIATFTENGETRIEASPDVTELDDKSLAEYAKANPEFIDSSALLHVAQSMKKNPDFGINQIQLNRKQELQAGISKLAESDAAIKTHIEEIAKGFSQSQRSTGTTIVGTVFGAIPAAAIAGTNLALKAGYNALTGQAAPELPTGVMSKTPEALAEYLSGNTELARRFTKKEILDASRDIATSFGIDAVGYDEANPAASVRKLSTGQLVMPTSVMANKALFDTALAKSGATEAQKKLALTGRADKLDAMGKQLIPILAEADSDVLDFYNEKKAEKWTDGAILDSLSSNVKYNGVLNRVENFGLNTLKTVTDLIPAIGKILPDGGLIEGFGYGINKKINDEMAANQQLAKLSGKDMGWAQQLFEQIPQLIADIFVSRGAGKLAGSASRAAAFVAPQTMAKLELFRTLKLPSLVGREAAESIAKKFTLDPNMAGWMVSQGARTFGSTYVSTRTSLEAQTNADGTPKYSPEQIDALATETAVLNAAAGNAITYAFNKISGGALAGSETLAAGKGFSTKKLRGFYDDLSKGIKELPAELKGSIKLDSFEDFIRSSTGFWASKYGEVALSGIGEGLEEFVQTVTEETLSSIATGQDLDLVQVGKQAALAASFGAALGGGADLASKAEANFFRDPQYQQLDFEERALAGTIEKLRAANSPATAAFLESQLATSREKKQTLRTTLAATTKDYNELVGLRKSLIDDVTPDRLNNVEMGEEMTVSGAALYSRRNRLQQLEQRLLAETPEDQMSEEKIAQLNDIRVRLAEAEKQITGEVIPATGVAAPVEPLPPVREVGGQLEWTFLDELESESRIQSVDDKPATLADGAIVPDTGTAPLAVAEPEPTIAQRVNGVLAERFKDPVAAIDKLRKSKDRGLAERFGGHVIAAEEADNELHAMQVERAGLLRQRNELAPLLSVEVQRAEMRAKAEQQRQQLKETGAFDADAPLVLQPVDPKVAEYTAQRAGLDARIAELDSGIATAVDRRSYHVAAVGEVFDVRVRQIDDAISELKLSVMQQLEDGAETVATLREAKAEPVAIEAAQIAIQAEVAATIAEEVAVAEVPVAQIETAMEEVRAEVANQTGKQKKAKAAFEKLAALMPAKEDIAAVKPEALAEMTIAVRDLKIDWKANVVNKIESRDGVSYLKNTDSPDGFATAGGFDLFNELLAVGTIPESKVLNSILKQRDYAKVEYAAAFRHSLKAAIEVRYPVYAAPDTVIAKDEDTGVPDVYGVYIDTFRSTVGRLHVDLKVANEAVARLRGESRVRHTVSAATEWRKLRTKAAKKLDALRSNVDRSESKKFIEASYRAEAARVELQQIEEELRSLRDSKPLDKAALKVKVDSLMANGELDKARALLDNGPATPLQLRVFAASSFASELESRISLAEEHATAKAKEIRDREAEAAALKAKAPALFDKIAEAEAALAKIDARRIYTDVGMELAIRDAQAAVRAVRLKIANYAKDGEFLRKRNSTYESRLRVKRGTSIDMKIDGDVRSVKLPLVKSGDTLVGFHTNDPRLTAALLNEGWSVFVPKNQRKTLNPAIVLDKKGYVKHVKLHDTEVRFAGDLSPLLEKAYEPEELKPDNAEFVNDLPPVPARLTYLLGRTAVTGSMTLDAEAASALSEDQYVSEALMYLLNRDVAFVRQMEDKLMQFDQDYTDLATAIVYRYMRNIREFALARQLRDMKIAGDSNAKITAFMKRQFVGADGNLAPAVEKQLRKQFGTKIGRNGSTTVLLNTYAAQLMNEIELSASSLGVDLREVSMLLEGDGTAEQIAKTTGRRFAAGQPAALRTYAAQVFRNYRDALAKRAPKGLQTDSIEANAAFGDQPVDHDNSIAAAESIAQAMAAGSFQEAVGEATYTEEAVAAASEQPVTYGSEHERVIAAIDASAGQPEDSRAALVKLSAAYGVTNAADRSTRELLELFRDELAPLERSAVEATRAFIATESDRIYKIMMKDALEARIAEADPASAKRMWQEAIKQSEQQAAVEEINARRIVNASLRPLAEFSAKVKADMERINDKERRKAARRGYFAAMYGKRGRIAGQSEITPDNVWDKLEESFVQFADPQRGDTTLALDRLNYGVFYGVVTEGKHAGLAAVHFWNKREGKQATAFLPYEDIFTVARPVMGADGTVVRTERLRSLEDRTTFEPPTIGDISPETRRMLEKEGSYAPTPVTEGEQYERVRRMLEGGVRPAEQLFPAPEVVTLPDGAHYTKQQLFNLIEYLNERAAEADDETVAAAYEERAKVLAGFVATAQPESRIFHSVSAPTIESMDDIIGENDAEIEAYGLQSGNPNSVIEALDRLPADLQPVAKLLAKQRALLTGMQFDIVTLPNTGWAGKYSPASRTITLNRAATNGRGLADALVHELLHDVLVSAIRSNSPAAKRLVAKLDAIRRNARAKTDAGSDPQLLAGLSSLDEFTAYAMTSKDFQRKLTELDDTRNFLQKFIDAIVSFFTGNPASVNRIVNDIVKLAGYSNPRPYGAYMSEDAIRSATPKAAEADSAYLAAVAAGDTETAQRMVDTAAKEAGYDSPIVWHGSPKWTGEPSDFTEFKKRDGGSPAFWFTTEQALAIDYAMKGKAKSFYLKESESYGNPKSMFVVESASQIKSADPITYDESGNVIPLSKRFNVASDSILYSIAQPKSNIVYDNTLPTAFASKENSDSVFVNPVLADELTSEMSERNAKNLLRSLESHELAHIAAFKTLTQPELDSVVASLSAAQQWEVADRYYAQVEPDSELRFARLEADRASGEFSDSKLAYEWLRAESEKLVSGFTSEEQLSFYRRNPNLAQSIIHYLAGFINRLVARITGPADSYTAAILNRVTRAHQKLIGGETVESVDNALDKIAAGEASFVYAMPVAAGGSYDARGPIRKWLSQRFGTGDAPQVVKTLLDERNGMFTADFRTVNKFVDEMADHYKRGLITVDDDANISAALGGHVSPDKAAVASLNKWYDAQLEQASDDFHKTNRLAADRTAYGQRKSEIEVENSKRYNDLWRNADNGEVRKQQAEALARLPEPVAATLNRIREATIRDTRLLVEDPNMPVDLKVVLNANMGIHVVRAYRAFTQKGWFTMVRAGKTMEVAGREVDFEKIKNNAMTVFTQFAEKSLTEKYKAEQMTDAAIRARVRAEIGDVAGRMLDSFIARYGEIAAGLTLGQLTPNTLLRSLMKGDTARFEAHEKTANELKAEMGHYLARKNVPDWMRELMGEITDPVEAAVRSYVTVATLAANHSFLSRVKKEGLEGGWLTFDPNSMHDGRDYTLLETKSDGESVAVLGGMYGPKEFKSVLETKFRHKTGALEDTAERVVSDSVGALRSAAGKAMGIKTLLSVGYIPRNTLSDFLFFAPFQGLTIDFFNRKRWKTSAAAAFTGVKAGEDVEPYIDKLIRLSILNDDSRTSALRQQIHGYSEDPDKVLARMRELTYGSQSATALDSAKSVFGKVKGVFSSPMDVMAKASATVGNHLKIAVYEQELDTLRKAYGDDPEWNTADEIGITKLEREAARKTNMTTQTRSQVAPVISSLTRSPLGSLFAPFASFKSEVARIMYNTPTLAYEEIKSGNDVIRRRGIKRLTGMVATLVLLPAVVDGTIRFAFAALGKTLGDDDDDMLMSTYGVAMRPRTDEERRRDEALRAGLPIWQTGNPISFAVSGGKTRVVDMSYINPFTIWTSPFLRSFEHVRNGDEDKIAGTFGRWATQQLVGEQIAFGAVNEAMNNRDDKGNLIATKDMPFMESVWTRTEHALKNAYMPPVFNFANRLYEGTGGSQKASTAAAHNRNRIELALGELMGIRPRVYDNERLYETGVRRAHSDYRDVRSATSVATSNYPVEAGAISEAFDRNNRARLTRSGALKLMTDEFGKLGIDTGRLISLAREAGVSKEVVQAARAGYVPAYSPSMADKRAAFQRREAVDGTGAAALKEMADAQRKWPAMIPIE